MNSENHPLITLPINTAHLMSLAGFLQEFATPDQHRVFSMQIALQAKSQGLDVFNVDTFSYKDLVKQTMQFSAPIDCIADVGSIMMNAIDDPETKQDIVDSLEFLMSVWAPFAAAALASHKDEGKTRLDLGPESLN